MPTLEAHLVVPARRARRRPRHLDPTGRGQPHLDRDPEREYDLHGCSFSPRPPDAHYVAGVNPFTDETASPAPHPDRNSA